MTTDPLKQEATELKESLASEECALGAILAEYLFLKASNPNLDWSRLGRQLDDVKRRLQPENRSASSDDQTTMSGAVYQWCGGFLWRNGKTVGYVCYRDSPDKLLIYSWGIVVGDRRFGRATSPLAAVDTVETLARTHFGDEV